MKKISDSLKVVSEPLNRPEFKAAGCIIGAFLMGLAVPSGFQKLVGSETITKYERDKLEARIQDAVAARDQAILDARAFDSKQKQLEQELSLRPTAAQLKAAQDEIAAATTRFDALTKRSNLLESARNAAELAAKRVNEVERANVALASRVTELTRRESELARQLEQSFAKIESLRSQNTALLAPSPKSSSILVDSFTDKPPNTLVQTKIERLEIVPRTIKNGSACFAVNAESQCRPVQVGQRHHFRFDGVLYSIKLVSASWFHSGDETGVLNRAAFELYRHSDG